MYLLQYTLSKDGGLTTKLVSRNHADVLGKYIILSHRWVDAEQEITFADMMSGKAGSKDAYAKLEGFCRTANRLHPLIEYLWCDTYGIDKSSSAELSESLLSMFNYYKESAYCYIYLDDFVSDDISEDADSFQKCIWFTRGWTLQELIAPLCCIFFNKRWQKLCTLSYGLMDAESYHVLELLSETTGIRDAVLMGQVSLEDCSVAEKMSWAAKRRTTRLEDRAYSLIGIFNISMPILYGEGPKAFIRLQKEIISISNDQSIFAWNSFADESRQPFISSMLAPSPASFAQIVTITSLHSHMNECVPLEDLKKAAFTDYSLTNVGLSILLPCFTLPIVGEDIIACVLPCFQCSHEDAETDPRLVQRVAIVYLDAYPNKVSSGLYRRCMGILAGLRWVWCVHLAGLDLKAQQINILPNDRMAEQHAVRSDSCLTLLMVTRHIKPAPGSPRCCMTLNSMYGHGGDTVIECHPSHMTTVEAQYMTGHHDICVLGSRHRTQWQQSKHDDDVGIAHVVSLSSEREWIRPSIPHNPLTWTRQIHGSHWSPHETHFGDGHATAIGFTTHTDEKGTEVAVAMIINVGYNERYSQGVVSGVECLWYSVAGLVDIDCLDPWAGAIVPLCPVTPLRSMLLDKTFAPEKWNINSRDWNISPEQKLLAQTPFRDTFITISGDFLDSGKARIEIDGPVQFYPLQTSDC